MRKIKLNIGYDMIWDSKSEEFEPLSQRFEFVDRYREIAYRTSRIIQLVRPEAWHLDDCSDVLCPIWVKKYYEQNNYPMKRLQLSTSLLLLAMYYETDKA